MLRNQTTKKSGQKFQCKGIEPLSSKQMILNQTCLPISPTLKKYTQKMPKQCKQVKTKTQEINLKK